jgi:hypothetical protein
MIAEAYFKILDPNEEGRYPGRPHKRWDSYKPGQASFSLSLQLEEKEKEKRKKKYYTSLFPNGLVSLAAFDCFRHPSLLTYFACRLWYSATAVSIILTATLLYR